METTENDLLVAIPSSNYYEDGDPSSNGHNGDLNESLVPETKHSSFLEYEGNINCAMDIFAPDHGSHSSKNSEYSTSGCLSGGDVCDKDGTMSDFEMAASGKATSSCDYVSFLNEETNVDSASLSSNVSDEGRNICSRKNPSTRVFPDRGACISPHFPSSNITFPQSSQCRSPSTPQWSTFGENKENTIPASPYKSKYFPTRPPPAIPERKSLRRVDPVARSSPIQQHHSSTSSPTADLLSMDMVDLQNHLSDGTSSPIPSLSITKPIIPPRKNLLSTGSTSSKSQFSDAEVDLIASSLPEGHINLAHYSSDSSPVPLPSTSQIIKGPPVPPRKNAPKVEINILAALATADNSVNSGSNSFSFPLQNTETISGSESCPSWVNFADSSTDTVNNSSCNILDTKTAASPCNKDSATEEIKPHVAEDSHWSMRLSPDPRSTVKKKGTGGIGYLSLENDDCGTMGSIDDIGSSISVEDGVVISLPTNDLSPEKPQSQWATFHNEEDDEEKVDANIDSMSCGAVSLPSGALNSSGSGFAGSFNDVDVADLEDDFVINPNRLSAEMPNLKGFNRADKGSQNNLVDFSDDRGSVAVSIGSHDDGDEDVETIIDLTAQGDSLKRKRPRGSITVVTNFQENVTDGSVDSSAIADAHPDPESHANVSFHVGPAGHDDFVFTDECDSFHTQTKYVELEKTDNEHPSSCSSRAETPAICSTESNCDPRQSISSNPFWSPSLRTAPSTGSQSSFADTPFDAFVFSSSKSSISHNKSKPTTPIRINPISTPSTPVPLIRIPPPPLSQSRSSSRHRRSSHAIGRTRHTSHDSRKRLELGSSSDFSQSVSTLPSSGAETPTLVTTNKEAGSEREATPSPSDFVDNILEPFPIEQWPDLATSDSISKNLFTWLDESQPDGCLIEERTLTDNGKTIMNSTNDTLPSDQRVATISLSSQKNCNMNANVAEPEATSKNFILDINTALHNNGNEVDDLMPSAGFARDSLTKQSNTQSPENLVKSTENNSILPEIDLVQSRSSWDVFMRFPMSKRTMSNRKWVPIHIKLFNDPVDRPLLKLYYTANVVEPFHTLSLASHQMQMSKPVLQSHISEDGQILGKLHALKLNIVQYKEKQTFTQRSRTLTRNASGFKHTSKVKQTIKLGFSQHYEIMSFVKAARDTMFYAHKLSPKSSNDEHTPTMKYHSRNEILVDVVDEVQAVVDESGVLKACKVRVHFFVGSFLSGDPMAKININDQKVEGKEVVARGDIIPSSLEGWIEVRDPELHESCTSDSFQGDNAGMCICYPPDACRFELMRFKTNYTESELPLKVNSNAFVKCARLHLRCIVMLNDKIQDGLGQLVCEDIMVRFPVPDDWCAYFKVEGKFKKHTIRAKRSAKCNIKTPTGVAMVASIGFAKYEKAYQAIVWRIPRLPDKGAHTKPHAFSCRIELVSDRDLHKLSKIDEVAKTESKQGTLELDDKFKFCEIEYSMVGPVASKVGINVEIERIADDDDVDPADLCLTH